MKSIENAFKMPIITFHEFENGNEITLPSKVVTLMSHYIRAIIHSEYS